MDRLICEFCDATFLNNTTLKKHQKTSKSCLELRSEISDEHLCDHCLKTFCNSFSLSRHIKNCKSNISIEKLKKDNTELKTSLLILENKYKDLLISNTNLEEKYKLIENKYSDLVNKTTENLKENVKSLELLASKAIENVGNKTINNNNTTNRNKIINNLLPLTDDYMRDQSRFLTYKNVQNGIEGLAEFASNHTFKDRLYCSDVSRLNFIFKNENEEVIKDPEGIEITKRFIEINKEELLRLLEEYLNSILDRLFDPDIVRAEYEVYAKRREEIIATRNAVKKGNIAENTYSYNEFKKSFLLALSSLIPR